MSPTRDSPIVERRVLERFVSGNKTGAAIDSDAAFLKRL